MVLWIYIRSDLWHHPPMILCESYSSLAYRESRPVQGGKGVSLSKANLHIYFRGGWEECPRLASYIVNFLLINQTAFFVVRDCISSPRHSHCFHPRTRHNMVETLFAVIIRDFARSNVLSFPHRHMRQNVPKNGLLRAEIQRIQTGF